jgi:hypothetical protein
MADDHEGSDETWALHMAHSVFRFTLCLAAAFLAVVLFYVLH